MIFLGFFLIFFTIYLGVERSFSLRNSKIRRSILNIIYFLFVFYFVDYEFLNNDELTQTIVYPDYYYYIVNSIARGYRLFDTFIILGNLDLFVTLPSYELTYNILNIFVSFSVYPSFFFVLGISDVLISVSDILIQTYKYNFIFRFLTFILLRVLFVFYYSWVYSYYTPFIWLLAFRSLFYIMAF